MLIKYESLLVYKYLYIINIYNMWKFLVGFGIGIYVDKIHIGFEKERGEVRWSDVRLVLKFEFTTEPETVQKGGVAFGDDISGYNSKYTSASPFPYGYMRTQKYTDGTDYRSYAQWDVSKIRNAFPQENFSKLIITKVSVRFNHAYCLLLYSR